MGLLTALLVSAAYGILIAQGSDIFLQEGVHYLVLERDFKIIPDQLQKLKSANVVLERVNSEPDLDQDVKSLTDRCMRNVMGRILLLENEYEQARRFREKKSIEIMGELWATLTGGPSPSEWQTTQKMMKELTESRVLAGHEFVTLEKIVKENTVRLEKAEYDFKKGYDDIINVKNEMQSELRRVMKVIGVCEELSMVLHLVELEIGQMKSIMEAMMDGRLAMGMIEMDRLEKLLEQISLNKPLKPVFANDQIQQIYKERITVTHLENDKFVSVIRIPLIDENKILIKEGFVVEHQASLYLSKDGRFHFYVDKEMEGNCKPYLDIKGKICKLRPVEIYGGKKSNKTIIEREENVFNFEGMGGIYTLDCDNNRDRKQIADKARVFLPANCNLVGEDAYIKAVKNGWDRVEKYQHINLDIEDALKDALELTDSLKDIGGILATDGKNSKEKGGQEAGKDELDQNTTALESEDWKELVRLREKQEEHKDVLKSLSEGMFWQPVVTGAIGSVIVLAFIAGMSVVCCLYCKFKQKFDIRPGQ